MKILIHHRTGFRRNASWAVMLMLLLPMAALNGAEAGKKRKGGADASGESRRVQTPPPTHPPLEAVDIEMTQAK